MCGFRKGPKAVGEPDKVGLVDGAQHLGDRTLDDFVLQSRHAERPLVAIGLGDHDAPNRLRPVSPRVDTRAQVRELGLKVLLVRLHRHPVDARARPPLLSPERAFERGLVDVMQQGGEPGMDGSSSRRVHPSEVRRQGGPAPLSGLGVRALAPSRGLPSGRPLPSARLVSFDGFIGTMNRSDSRPRLGCELRQCLARIPRR